MKDLKFENDDRGGIMYIALVLAIFGVAMVYSTIGITQAALFRQSLQDGADVSALSGAVMQARSMNLVVLLNIVMAALLSVLVALKLVEAVCIAGMIISVAVAYPTWGASLAFLSPLENIRNNFKNLHDNLEDPINNAIEAVHDLSDIVVEVAPGVALGVAKGTRTAAVEEVLVGMAEGGLPVEDDEFNVLCGEAGRLPADVAADSIPLPKEGFLKSAITEPIGEAMEAMASTFSEWFCGDGGDDGGPPGYDVTETVWYPQDELGEACGSTVSSVMNQDYERVASQDTLNCAAKAEEAQAASPHSTTGECERRCGVDEPYERKAQLAREVCKPTDKSFTLYSYQQRSGSVVYEWKDRQWVRGTPEYKPPELKQEERHPPCGVPGKRAISPDYNLLVRTSDDVSELIPVCSNEQAPSASPRARLGTRPITVEFVEVTHMLGCAREETKKVQVNGNAFAVGPSESGDSGSSGDEEGSADSGGGASDSEGAGSDSEDSEDSEESGDDSEDRLPKRVKETLTLGDNDFIIRTVVVGKTRASTAERAVRLALWNKKEKENPLEKLRQFGGFNLAQAEFFYDGDLEDRDAWMWNMYWKARLVRFRATEEQLNPLYAECDGVLGLVTGAVGDVEIPGADEVIKAEACRPFLDKVFELGSLITH